VSFALEMFLLNIATTEYQLKIYIVTAKSSMHL